MFTLSREAVVFMIGATLTFYDNVINLAMSLLRQFIYPMNIWIANAQQVLLHIIRFEVCFILIVNFLLSFMHATVLICRLYDLINLPFMWLILPFAVHVTSSAFRPCDCFSVSFVHEAALFSFSWHWIFMSLMKSISPNCRLNNSVSLPFMTFSPSAFHIFQLFSHAT